MEEKNMSLRTFQKRFAMGDFDAKDRRTQIDAGWYDWFCNDDSLAAKTKRMGKVVAQLTDSTKVDRDKMYVWFKNNCPVSYPLYDDFRIASMETGDTLYTVTYREPYDEEKSMWIVYDIMAEDEGRRFKSYKFKTTKALLAWFNGQEV